MAAKKKSPPVESSFEEALERLEAIVEELERKDPPLERAMELFEEGVKLGRRCGARLEEAEKRISLLVERADGSLGESELDPGGGGAPAGSADDRPDEDGIPF